MPINGWKSPQSEIYRGQRPCTIKGGNHKLRGANQHSHKDMDGLLWLQTKDVKVCFSCFPISGFHTLWVWKLFLNYLWVRNPSSGLPENGHVGNFFQWTRLLTATGRREICCQGMASCNVINLNCHSTSCSSFTIGNVWRRDWLNKAFRLNFKILQKKKTESFYKCRNCLRFSALNRHKELINKHIWWTNLLCNVCKVNSLTKYSSTEKKK